MLLIIDRYISKLFLGFFVGGLVVFVTLFLSVDFLSAFAQFEPNISDLFAYYAFYIPEVIYQMFPVACLLATVFTLSTMNRSNELTALMSLGHSFTRISAPVLFWVGLLSFSFYWIGDQLIPITAQKKNYVFYVNIQKKPSLYSTVKTDKIWYRSDNILFNIQTLDPVNRTAQGITLYYFDAAWSLVRLVQAKFVAMQDNNTWELKEGIVTLFAEESSFPLTKSFDRQQINMGEELADIQSTASSSDVMSQAQLSRFIDKNKKAGLNTLSYEVDYHGKFSFAFAAIVMVLIGLPFSSGHRRSGGLMMNMGFCLLLAFIYWMFYSGFMTFGRNGVIPPVLAAWLPNLIMGAYGLFLIRKVRS